MCCSRPAPVPVLGCCLLVSRPDFGPRPLSSLVLSRSGSRGMPGGSQTSTAQGPRDQDFAIS
eukprot:2696000-Pyramimonas_sp.AAC.1